jgi:hypothetical protein
MTNEVREMNGVLQGDSLSPSFNSATYDAIKVIQRHNRNINIYAVDMVMA